MAGKDAIRELAHGIADDIIAGQNRRDKENYLRGLREAVVRVCPAFCGRGEPVKFNGEFYYHGNMTAWSCPASPIHAHIGEVKNGAHR